jgi:hypothetical protein
MNQHSVIFASASAVAALLLPACDIQWDLAEEAPQRTYAEQVAYGEDGGIVVFTGAGIMVHDAELASKSGAIELDGAAGGALHGIPFSFAMSDDGTVAAVTFSNTVERDVVLYDMASLAELTALDVESDAAPVQGVAIDPTGERVFVRGEHWGMFDVATGAQLWGSSGGEAACCGVQEPTFSRDGKVFFGFEGTRLEARHAGSGELIYAVESGSTRGAHPTLARSGVDGVLVGTRSTFAERNGESFEQTYVFWSEADGSVVRELPQLADGNIASSFPTGGTIACSPTGDVCASALVQGLATPELEHSIALWSAEDGSLLHELPVFANGVAFSPDGAFVAVAGGPAQLFRVEDGSMVSAFAYDYGDF